MNVGKEDRDDEGNARAIYARVYAGGGGGLIESGQSTAAAVRRLVVVEQTLSNWTKAQRQARPKGTDSGKTVRRADGDQPIARRVGASQDGARHLRKSGKTTAYFANGQKMKYSFI